MGYQLDSAQKSVARDLIRAWEDNDGTPREQLAIIEAGLVESTLRNLNYGDRDSLGVLQQRANWGSTSTRLDVYASGVRFMEHARQFRSRAGSAGNLAQWVQVSAYPDRYDGQHANALSVLSQVASGGGAVHPSGPIHLLPQSSPTSLPSFPSIAKAGQPVGESQTDYSPVIRATARNMQGYGDFVSQAARAIRTLMR